MWLSITCPKRNTVTTHLFICPHDKKIGHKCREAGGHAALSHEAQFHLCQADHLVADGPWWQIHTECLNVNKEYSVKESTWALMDHDSKTSQNACKLLQGILTGFSTNNESTMGVILPFTLILSAKISFCHGHNHSVTVYKYLYFWPLLSC